LDREVARARRRAENARSVADAEEAALNALLRAQAELFEAIAEQHRSLDLHTGAASSSVNYMNPVSHETPKKIGRPIISDHPFVARALKLHGSIKAAAKALGVHPSTARSWYASGDDARPIPATTAARLAKAPWNISQSAWKRIG
jgi:hypothetical protein